MARSVWRSWRRSPRRPGACSTTAAGRAGALVDGWQAAFTGSAIFMVAGLVLLLVLLRPRDVAQVDTEQPVAVAA